MHCTVVLGGCKISSFSLGKENRILKVIFNVRENMYKKDWTNWIVTSLIMFIIHQILFDWVNQIIIESAITNITLFFNIWICHLRLRHFPPGRNLLPLEGFSWSLMFEHLSQICRKNQVSLKADYNNGHFTGRPICSFDNISLISSYNEKCFRKNYRENQNTRFMFNIVFPKIILLFR
jgi:hypothetical protein